MCRVGLVCSASGLKKYYSSERRENIPSVAARSSRPSPYAVVGADEVVAGVNGIVAVGMAPDLLAVDDSAMRAEGIREGGRGAGEKGRGKRAWRALRKDADARLESEWESRQPRASTLLLILNCVALRSNIIAVAVALLCERRICARAEAAPRRDKHYAQLR